MAETVLKDDSEMQLARRISAIWGYPGRIHQDARDLAKTLILDGWRAPESQDSSTTTTGEQ